MAGFQDLIRFIIDGEQVAAGVANRAPLALDANVRYLKDILEAALLGSTVFARGKTVKSDVLVGQPVYYNDATQQFEAARAAVVEDEDTGQLVTAKCSRVWGVVYTKLLADKADILLHGVVQIDLSAAVAAEDIDDLAGTVLYLSAASPGLLVLQEPPVSIPVLHVGAAVGDGVYEVYVNPTVRELLEAHRHYRFELAAVPAGEHTPPLPEERHVIEEPDPGIEGWLPADHEVFGGLAPAGAAFGYNLSASPLGSLWPPIPVEGVYLEWNRGEDATLLGMGVPPGASDLVVFDRNGIWWMSDCYGDVPWPIDYGGVGSEESEGSETPECPRVLHMRLTLWFTKPVFFSAGSAVLSLRAAADSGIIVRCVDGGGASTGHLELDLDLDLAVTSQTQAGHVVFKAFDQNHVLSGPVVEGIKAGSENVQLASNLGELPESGVAQGIVTVTVDSSVTGAELAVDTVRLDGVTEEFYAEVIALGFSPTIAAEFRGRVNVPASLPAGTGMKLRLRLLGRSAGTVADDALTAAYRVIPRPDEPVELPAEDTALALSVGETLGSSNLLWEAESAEFAVTAGDVVLFTIARAGGDGYAGEIHVVQCVGVLTQLAP